MPEQMKHTIEVEAVMDRIREIRDIFLDNGTAIVHGKAEMPEDNRKDGASYFQEILDDWDEEKSRLETDHAAD